MLIKTDKKMFPTFLHDHTTFKKSEILKTSAVTTINIWIFTVCFIITHLKSLAVVIATCIWRAKMINCKYLYFLPSFYNNYFVQLYKKYFQVYNQLIEVMLSHIYFDFFGMYIIETHCIQNYTWMELLPWGLILLKAHCIYTVYIFSNNYEEILLVFFFFSKNETLIIRPSRCLHVKNQHTIKKEVMARTLLDFLLHCTWTGNIHTGFAIAWNPPREMLANPLPPLKCCPPNDIAVLK